MFPMMGMERPLFDRPDADAEAKADARAEADVDANRLVSHASVRKWLASIANGAALSRPKVGD